MSLAKIVRGDPENPSGKVWVYSKIDNFSTTEKFDSKNILFFYASEDLTDLGKKKERFNKKFKVRKRYPYNFKKEKIDFLGEVYFSNLFLVDSEEDIFENKGDVIDAGTYSKNTSFNEKIMNMATMSYFYGYIDNFLKREIQQKKEDEWKAEAKKLNIDYRNFDSVANHEKRSYIMNNFIRPFLNESIHNRENAYLIKKHFFKFASETKHHFEDMKEVMKIIEKTNRNPDDDDLRLINHYLLKIQAVHNEEFEQAAELRDKIKSFSRY